MTGQGRAKRVGAVAGALALAGVLTGVGTGCTPFMEAIGEAPPSAEPVPCPEGGVRLLEGTGNAAMGLRVGEVQLLNCGTRPYLLAGHPDLRLLDREERPVEVSVGQGSNGVVSSTGLDSAPQPVTLRPGESASVSLLWRNLVTDGTPAEGWVVDLAPKPGAPRLRLRLTVPVDLGTTGKLGVGPWRPAGR
ncbi:DUF4232 domain-containing protein [Streptomyces sp. NBC_00091]|uniref:DUF4232 domain-containing protein n=1 Tax=Streptomyces sp. NBC_00091 TaxID=2975648 RepID=UPI0022593FCB|nr:DUF4232 domain-containing protein [Streptomyces sp. NBC_00091]MCX5378351.1 DUF4232 domain-containing protein [Streptomyces sp. NBC_00091]